MNSLRSGPAAEVLARLFQEAATADRAIVDAVASHEAGAQHLISKVVDAERADLAGLYRRQAANFLAISPDFGRLLYACARFGRVCRIVEFGTSMGISAIHLAAALRDMGGGELIGTEIEPTKADQARANLSAAGLSELAEIRVGDARETLKDISGEIDMILLDGAFTLYLDVLRLLEPHLRPGALVLAENAFEQADGYLAYISDPSSDYMPMRMPGPEGRGNELSVFTRGLDLRMGSTASRSRMSPRPSATSASSPAPESTSSGNMI